MKQFPPSAALAAIDLGAESCRVSLLRWIDGKPVIQMVHRFANGAQEKTSPAGQAELHWDLTGIVRELETGLRRCAEIATEGITAVSTDGWSVDYCRLDDHGQPLLQPFCYRDPRTVDVETTAYQTLAQAGIDRDRLYSLTGTDQFRINTMFQLLADTRAGVAPAAPWVMLPEYILHWLGGDRVAELTNATHTGLVRAGTNQWCEEVFAALGLSMSAAPKLVGTGTITGRVTGPLAGLPAFAQTRLIAGATHDTAAAIAGIPAEGHDGAYISSGTWSLVGAVLESPCTVAGARAAGFTNLGAAGGQYLFHKLVNAMWLLRQSIEHWALQGKSWEIRELVIAAENITAPTGLIDVDDPDLLLPGDMPGRINRQRQRRQLPPLSTAPADAPVLARLIFDSLAARYAQILADISQLTGKKFSRIHIVGGGSQNRLLNAATEKATGLAVIRAAVESSTLGNFAVQLAALEAAAAGQPTTAASIAGWSRRLVDASPH